MRVFLYLRVSSKEQIEGYSLGEQEERLRAFCKAKGWKVAKVFNDGGYSGANTNRPALSDLVRAIEKHQADAVLVYKLDRLSRSQKDTLTLIDTFLQNHCDFVSMTENFDTSSPFGRAMIGILSVFAQLEREQIKERMQMGKEGRAKQGKYHGGGVSPVGYDYKDGHLVINEFEALHVREMHEMFQQGVPLRVINKKINEKYGKYYEARTIKRTLKNPLYIGKIKHNNTLYDGEHQPIIDEETFNKTKELLDALPPSTKPNMNTYLGGILYCGQCGAKYGVKMARDTRYNRTYRYYMCHSKMKTNKNMIKDENCQNKIYPVDKLDEIIFSEIRKLKIEKNFKTICQNDDDNTDIITHEIQKLENQKSRLIDLYSLGTFSVEELQNKITPLQEQIDILYKQIKKPATSQKKAHEMIQSFDDILDNGNFDDIKLLIDALIDRVEIDGEDVTIFWAFI